MLSPDNFKCERKCGKCCIDYTVLLYKKDIERIKTLGYQKEHFVEYERIGPERGKPILKKKSDKWCVFLKKSESGIFSCGIYDARPEICKKYPFFGRAVESCIPLSQFINIKG